MARKSFRLTSSQSSCFHYTRGPALVNRKKKQAGLRKFPMPSPRKYALRVSCFFSACLRLPDANAPWFTAKTDSAKSTLNQESTLPVNRASDGTSETLLDSMSGASNQTLTQTSGRCQRFSGAFCFPQSLGDLKEKCLQEFPVISGVFRLPCRYRPRRR